MTIQDVVEQLIGEMQDEFDQEEPVVQQVGEDTYSVDGTAK